MEMTYKELEDRLYKAVENAVSITWDECHKIYVLMTQEAHATMEGYGYKTLPIGKAFSEEKAGSQLIDWFELSCPLRFVQQITGTGNNSGDYTSVVDQFEYEEPEDSEDVKDE